MLATALLSLLAVSGRLETGTHGTDYRAIASLGCRYVRLWDFGDVLRGYHLEPTPHHFVTHTNTLERIRRAGLIPVGVLYTRQPWRCAADGLPDLAGRAWTDYVTEAVRRHQSHIRHWEIWNEPDTIEFGGHRSAADYVEMVRQAAAVIRVHRAGLVIGGSVSSLDNGWMDRYLAAGLAEHCDILSFHYTYTGSPDRRRQLDYIARVTALRERTGKPVWNTETSILRYSIEGGGPHLPEDAALARILRVNQQAGVAAVFYYYCERGRSDHPESLLDWRGYLRPWARVLRQYRQPLWRRRPADRPPSTEPARHPDTPPDRQCFAKVQQAGRQGRALSRPLPGDGHEAGTWPVQSSSTGQ